MLTKNIYPFILAASLAVFQSCTTTQFGGALAGGSIGGLFGSAIGGIIGGPRGADIGTLVGMTAGGAVGAAAAEAAEGNTREKQYTYDDVTYTRAKSRTTLSGWQDLQVNHVQFADLNEDYAINAGETAYLAFEIHNMSDRTLYDVAPEITCDNKHIDISPTAIISVLPEGGTVRYKAAVRASSRLKDGKAYFTIRFGTGKSAYIAKSFGITTRR